MILSSRRIVPLAAALLAIGTVTASADPIMTAESFRFGRFIAGRTPVLLVSDVFAVSSDLDGALGGGGSFPSMAAGLASAGGTVARTSNRSFELRGDDESGMLRGGDRLAAPSLQSGASNGGQQQAPSLAFSPSAPPSLAFSPSAPPAIDLAKSALVNQVFDNNAPLAQEVAALGFAPTAIVSPSAPVPTPEPAALILLGTGLLGLGSRRLFGRRRG